MHFCPSPFLAPQGQPRKPRLVRGKGCYPTVQSEKLRPKLVSASTRATAVARLSPEPRDSQFSLCCDCFLAHFWSCPGNLLELFLVAISLTCAFSGSCLYVACSISYLLLPLPPFFGSCLLGLQRGHGSLCASLAAPMASSCVEPWVYMLLGLASWLCELGIGRLLPSRVVPAALSPQRAGKLHVLSLLVGYQPE